MARTDAQKQQSRTETKRRQQSADRTKAMSHPLRRAVLRELFERGEASPVEIFRVVGGSLHKVAYHMRKLEAYGYAEKVRQRQVRGAVENFYIATGRHMLDTEEWEELDPGEREGALIDFMQPIVDDFTAALRSGTLGRDADWMIIRTPIKATDRRGFEEMREAHRALYERLLEIQAESLERMRESGEEPISVSSGQSCFEVEGF